MGVRKDPKDHAVGNSIGPTASEFGHMSWKGESGSRCHYGLDPVYLNAGLMKPRRGFTLAAGKEKLGWARGLRLSFILHLFVTEG